MKQSILSDVRNLAGKSLIYGLGSVILKVIGFFLLPIYTRFLTPADYGVMAVTGTLMAVLGILYPLGLNGAVTRFYFAHEDEHKRRQDLGTIWIAMVGVALVTTLLLDRLGNITFSVIFRDIPFDPYIRLAIWISFFNVLSMFPLILSQVQERPTQYVSITLASTLLNIGLVIGFVVFRKEGVYGYLQGTFLASLLFAIPYVFLTLRNVRISVQWPVLKAALAFSLPLVPHGLAGWLLELSDRAILEHFVSLEKLGLYSLGYQFGGVMLLFITAFTNAWVPFLYKTMEQQEANVNQRIAHLATYYALILCFAGLGLALLVKYILLLLTTPNFHSAYQVTPWIVGGYLFNGLYIVPIGFLFWKEKTKAIPVITVSSGILNIILNLWLVPYYGIMAAAWATFLSYGLMLILAWRIALQVYPLSYEYRRLGQIGLVTIGIFILGSTVESSWISIELTIKILIWLIFPVILALLGFFTPTEREIFFSFIRRFWAKLRKELPHQPTY